jgi:hypothetical protein
LQPIQQEKTMSKKETRKKHTPAAEPGDDRKDVYTRVTERIIADLEQGVRTWMKPWSAAHTAGRISKASAPSSAPPLTRNALPISCTACNRSMNRNRRSLSAQQPNVNSKAPPALSGRGRIFKTG